MNLVTKPLPPPISNMQSFGGNFLIKSRITEFLWLNQELLSSIGKQISFPSSGYEILDVPFEYQISSINLTLFAIKLRLNKGIITMIILYNIAPESNYDIFGYSIRYLIFYPVKQHHLCTLIHYL